MRHKGRVAVVLAAVGFIATVSVTIMGAADDETVLITRPGVVFHKAGSSDFHGRGVERSLSQAQATGYLPCGVCFGKTMSTMTSRNGLSPSLLDRAIGTSVVGLPPGLARMTSVATQPNGTKPGTLYGSGLGREAIHDPFEAPRTIQRPAKEQGAYDASGRP